MAKITRIKASDTPREVANTDDQPPITREKVVIEDKKEAKAQQRLAKESARLKKRHEQERSGKKVFILFRPFVAFGRYLRDAWREIRQVRWPNRKTTWKMVLAVVIYTALFIILVMLLDSLFGWLSRTILK